MTVLFVHTFVFADANAEVNNSLQIIQDVILKVFPVAYPMNPHAHYHIQSMMECYKIFDNLEDDDELHNIKIPETEGIQDVTAPYVPTDPMTQPLKIKKVNIGMEENPKFSNIGYYWDEDTMEKITYLLHEFQDLFLTKLLEVKKISLKPYAKPVQ